MSDININIDISQVSQNLDGLTERLLQQIGVLGEATGQKMKAHAQTNAPWTDRTGDARNRLEYQSKKDETGVTISLFHQVEYGIYLELCNNENYAILKNSRDAILPEFLQAVQAIRL